MESVKEILMRRDGMSAKEAQELIDEFVKELGYLEDDEECGIEDAYDLIQDYFGLEPDYLMEFI
jgi:hypothetical protein